MMLARHILVVEDSDEDFATVLDAARCAGVPNEIRRATSGDECLQQLRLSALKHDALPALVLLDLNTPKCDGRDALREIKQDDRLRALPLVVLTTSANPRRVTTRVQLPPSLPTPVSTRYSPGSCT